MEIFPDYEILPLIDEVIKEQSEIYDMSPATVETILQTNKWNIDALVDAAAPSQEQEYTLEPHPISLCAICYDSDSPQGHTLGCGHTFCVDCTCGHIKAAVDGGPTCIRIGCLAYKCPAMIPRPIIETTLTTANEGDYLKKYHSHIIRDFINYYGKRGVGAARLIYCSNPQCNKVANVPYGYPSDKIACPCGTTTCAKCGGEYHAPCSCINLKRWNAKATDEGETAKWLTVNTKACPKCRVNIEKNQGCNHMTCRGCKHEFCWICFADWRGHDYGCTKAPELSPEIIASKTELENYAKVLGLYQNHAVALKYALGLPTYDISGPDRYLAAAKVAIIEARRFCKFVYVVLNYHGAAFGPLFHEYFQRFANMSDALQEYIERKDAILESNTAFTLDVFNNYQKDVSDKTAEIMRDLHICNAMLESVMNNDSDSLLTHTHDASSVIDTNDINNYEVYSDSATTTETFSDDDDDDR